MPIQPVPPVFPQPPVKREKPRVPQPPKPKKPKGVGSRDLYQAALDALDVMPQGEAKDALILALLKGK
jgi:hypothetical protein